VDLSRLLAPAPTDNAAQIQTKSLLTPLLSHIITNTRKHTHNFAWRNPQSASRSHVSLLFVSCLHAGMLPSRSRIRPLRYAFVCVCVCVCQNSKALRKLDANATG
jgi:hypothetical protein